MTLPVPTGGARPPSPRPAASEMALQDMLPHVLRLFRREPALAITLGYLLLVMAGIFYNARFFGQFGIPVLTLSQVSDFLIAGIQQPIAILLVLSTLPLCWLFDLANRRYVRRRARTIERLRAAAAPAGWQRLHLWRLEWRDRQVWIMPLSYLAVVVLYGWAFVAVYADYRVHRVREGDAAQVRVWLGGGEAGFKPEQAQAWTYLGAVANYVFVYDHAAGRSVILPVENIERIEPVKSAKLVGLAARLAPKP